MKKNELKLSSKIVKDNENVVTNEIDGEVVMVSIDNGEYYSLDNVGTRIFELIEDELKVSDIVDKLSIEFHAPKEKIEKETLAFIKKLLKKGILRIDD